uniref:PNPLA domain-containing protein n=1 Tax=Amphora coffeiformis TaxID=265554 RepID=A0A7S3LG81_9STRA|eukprot:scaffold521_cov167-Amphora_coffeaeformis.AAC.42
MRQVQMVLSNERLARESQTEESSRSRGHFGPMPSLLRLALIMSGWQCCRTLHFANAWSTRSRLSRQLVSLWSKTSEKPKEGPSKTALFDKEEPSEDIWAINASGSFGSLLLKMEKRSSELHDKNQSYVIEDDALEIDPVKGNRTASPTEAVSAEEVQEDSELILTSLDWEGAQQIDESAILIRKNISAFTSVREIPHNNPLGAMAGESSASILTEFSNDTTTAVNLTRRSKLYQRRMERDQKLLSLQVASSITTVDEWRTVCELTDGIYPLLELILQGANDTATEEEEDLARRSARTLRDLCAISPDIAAIITDGILRANYAMKGGFFRCLCQLLKDTQEVQLKPKGRKLRPARKQQQKTTQLYVTQVLLAMVVASDDAVHTVRETEGLKEAVLGCSSFATKERRRRWLRYPGEIVRFLWRSRGKGVANLRRPFLEAASVSFDLNGQVQRTGNQVLAAIGYNQWIPKIPGQRGLRILTLDGGGSRGMVAVTAMAALVEAAGGGAEICDSFDLLGGTSTGAIISFLTGLRQESSSEAVERYNQLIKQIFVKSSFATPLMLFTTATYDESPFMNILCNILRDDSMLDSRADPAVPLVFAVASKMSSTPTHVALFRNYNYASGEFPDSFTVDPELARKDLRFPLELEHPCIRDSAYKSRPRSSDKKSPGVRFTTDASRHPGSFRVLQRYALRASTAAPTVFKPVMMGGEMYCDGGIVASNPTAVAIHEARTLFPNIPIEMVVSIGTGAFMEQKSAPRIGWDGIIGQIVDSATDGEQVHHVLEDILGETSMLGTRSSVSRTKYFRFNPVIGMPDSFPIDTTDPEKLAQLRDITLQYMKQPEQQRKLEAIADIFKGRKRWKQLLP